MANWMRKVVVFTLLFATTGAAISADEKQQRKKYEPRWESLDGVPVPQWFDDGKFGIMIHWGPYSLVGYTPSGRGYAEHFPGNVYTETQRTGRNKPLYSFMKERFGATPPEFGYKDIVPMFKAENWNPDEWARLFKQAGARYVILTAEHHDGYALWNSNLTEWCATKVGPERDLVGDLAVAVRKQGLRYGLSYHRERHFAYYGKRRTPGIPVNSDLLEEIKRMPSAATLYGPFELDNSYMQDYIDRWAEISDKYQPDFMWVDDQPKSWMSEESYAVFLKYSAEMIADYLNKAQHWGKEVYLNNKGRNPNWPVDCGCREKDNLRMLTIGPKWQNPATIGTSYGYLRAEEEKDAYKSSTELVHLLCDTVSKNGNLLLNIGPRADGTIPQGMRTRLQAIGQWLKINGEAIYGTRPWKHFGEGDIRFTTKADALYVILLIGEHDNVPSTLTIESVKDWQASNIEAVRLLAGGPVTWFMEPKGLTVQLPAGLKGEHALTLKIIRSKPSMNAPSASAAASPRNDLPGERRLLFSHKYGIIWGDKNAGT